MAKKKSLSDKGPESSPSVPGQLSSKGVLSEPTMTKPAAPQPKTPASQQTWSNDTIGLTAGIIWSHLKENGELGLPALKKGINAPENLVLAAVGWLAREDKLDFVTRGRSIKIALR